jgi:glycosyltransferase involved in cell wall biosynthesis
LNIILADGALRFPTDEDTASGLVTGIASCVSYLGDYLAANGHCVSFLGACGPFRRRSGVTATRGVSRALLEQADAVIVCNCAEFATDLKPFIGPRTPLILWEHHPADVLRVDTGRFVHHLDTDHRHSPTDFVFVSQWQCNDYVQRFGLDPGRCHVVRNACAPPFTEAVAEIGAGTGDEAFFAARRQSLDVAYLSTHERGLATLTSLWLTILQRFPQARLAIYASKITQIANPSPSYDRLLDGSLHPSIEFRGALSHAELARRLAVTPLVAYPTWFKETACIALLEAMASGCRVVCSDRGALPESMAGHARIVPWSDDDAFAVRFAGACLEEMDRWTRGDTDLMAGLGRQRRLFRAAYRWPIRALDWESLIVALYRRAAGD